MRAPARSGGGPKRQTQTHPTKRREARGAAGAVARLAAVIAAATWCLGGAYHAANAATALSGQLKLPPLATASTPEARVAAANEPGTLAQQLTSAAGLLDGEAAATVTQWRAQTSDIEFSSLAPSVGTALEFERVGRGRGTFKAHESGIPSDNSKHKDAVSGQMLAGIGIASSTTPATSIGTPKPNGEKAGLGERAWSRFEAAVATAEQRQREKANAKSLLVRQLSDLIMNNGLEIIQQKLASARVNGKLMEETRRLTAAARGYTPPQLQLDDDDNDDAAGVGGNYVDVDDDEEGASLAADETVSAAPVPAETRRRRQMGPPLSGSPGPSSLEPAMSTLTTSQPALASPSPSSNEWPWAWLWSSANDRDAGSTTTTPSSTTTAGEADRDGFIEDSDADGTGAADSAELPDEARAQNFGIRLQGSTCPPDYEDGLVLVDAKNLSLNDLLSVSGLQAPTIGLQLANNLTAEQRQQMLNGADSTSLLHAVQFAADGLNNETATNLSLNSNSNSNNHHNHQHHQHHGLQLVSGCVPAGSQTIEIVTKIVTPILFSIIIIVGLLGNLIVVCVIWEDKKVERGWSPTNLLILDLSIADLSFIIFCIPFTGWDYAVGHWVFGPFWCKTNQYLIVVCALSSIYTLVLMSSDRFMAIVYPIECISYRTSKNMFKAIVIKWLVILLIASPTIYMHGLIEVEESIGKHHDSIQFSCRFLSNNFNPLHFQITFFITSYFLPLVLIFFLYWGLLKRLWCGTRPRGHKESTKALESKRKITRLVAVIVIVFALCWFPIQMMLILMRLKTYPITVTYVIIQVLAHTLGYMNSCVNPIIYAFASDSFYQSFRRSRWGGLCLAWFCFCKGTTSATNATKKSTNPPKHNHNQNQLLGHHQQYQQQQQQQHNHHNGLNNGGLSTNLSVQQQSFTTTTTVTIHSSSATKQQSTPPPGQSSLQTVTTTAAATVVAGGLPANDQAPATINGRRINKPPCHILGHSSATADVPATASTPPPPLEPRDRPTARHLNEIVRQFRQRQVQVLTSSSSASQLPGVGQLPATNETPVSFGSQTVTSNDFVCDYDAGAVEASRVRKRLTGSSGELIPRQPTTSARLFMRRPCSSTSGGSDLEVGAQPTVSKQQLVTRMEVKSSGGNAIGLIAHDCQQTTTPTTDVRGKEMQDNGVEVSVDKRQENEQQSDIVTSQLS